MKILPAIFLLHLVVVVSSTATWKKLNGHPVCYGAKGNSFGVFLVSKTTRAYQIKIEHITGSLTCNRRNYGYFRCSNHAFEVHVTDVGNRVIVPAAPVQYYKKPWYRLNGNDKAAKSVVLSTGLNPYTFLKHKTYRVWYGEDLFNFTEHDNAGNMCVNIYALA
eukprot:gene9994-11015_t